MNKAKRILGMMEQDKTLAMQKADYMDSDDKEVLARHDFDAILQVMAEVAETRSGDADDPKAKQDWAKTAKMLKDLIPKLPKVHY